MNHVAQVLLISDDQSTGRHYRGALEAAGYAVTQTGSFVDVIGSSTPDPDLILLCDLAVVAYPGQVAPMLRIPEKMSPDELVSEVHRKIALRASLLATT